MGKFNELSNEDKEKERKAFREFFKKINVYRTSGYENAEFKDEFIDFFIRSLEKNRGIDEKFSQEAKDYPEALSRNVLDAFDDILNDYAKKQHERSSGELSDETLMVLMFKKPVLTQSPSSSEQKQEEITQEEIDLFEELYRKAFPIVGNSKFIKEFSNHMVREIKRANNNGDSFIKIAKDKGLADEDKNNPENPMPKMNDICAPLMNEYANADPSRSMFESSQEEEEEDLDDSVKVSPPVPKIIINKVRKIIINKVMSSEAEKR